MTDDTLIPLENLRRLDIRPGDTLVITAPEAARSAAAFAQFGEIVRRAFADQDVQVKVLPPGTDIRVVATGDIAP